MLPVLGVDFKSKYKTQSNQKPKANLYQSKPDSVSFTGAAQKVGQTAGDSVTGVLSTIFKTNLVKNGSKYTSDVPISFYDIDDNRQFYHEFVEAMSGLLARYKAKKDLSKFANESYQLSMFQSLVFTGKDGEVYYDAAQQIYGSRFSLTMLRPSTINSTHISLEMKEVLNKEFAKHHDMLKVNYGKDNYILKNHRMYEDDPKSPMRSLEVVKVIPNRQ